MWLRDRLFHGRAYSDRDHAVRARYDDASRFALRFLLVLARLPAPARVEALRRFHRAPLAGKLELVLGR